MDDDDDFDPDIIGSCDGCGGDVDEDEACWIGGILYCDQCAWWILRA